MLTNLELYYLKEKLPRVVLIGRRNVGKSTLFNALLGKKRAIIYDEPGVTVDNISEIIMKTQTPFVILDMPGLDLTADDEISKKTYQLALATLKKTELILFIMEYPVVTSEDFTLLEIIRKSGKPGVSLLNKVDNLDLDIDQTVYYEMGLEEIIPISALGRGNLKTLLDKINKHLYGDSDERYQALLDSVRKKIQNQQKKDEYKTKENHDYTDKQPVIEPDLGFPIKIAIIGKPNSGKSSLVNKIIGYEKVLVTDISGTTKDSTDTCFRFRFKDIDRNLVILDTAGIRKKATQSKGVEFYSYSRAKKAIEQSDVVLHIMDCSKSPIISKADKKIGEFLKENLKPVIFVLNKWDCFDLGERKFYEFLEDLHRTFPFTRGQRIITVSALYGKRVPQMVNEAIQLADTVKERIPTSLLNRLLEKIMRYAPEHAGKKRLKINYAVQHSASPVKIKLFVKNKNAFTDNILSFIKKRISKEMNWSGVPIGLEITEQSRPGAGRPAAN
jgi:GTP-binding protein